MVLGAWEPDLTGFRFEPCSCAMAMATPSALQPLLFRAGPLALLALAGLLAAAEATTPAWASSPQAWAEHQRQVLKACTAASGLRQPRAAGERLDFNRPDGSRISVLLIEGRYPQPHMAGRRGLELCLFDPRSRKASVADADRLRTSHQP